MRPHLRCGYVVRVEMKYKKLLLRKEGAIKVQIRLEVNLVLTFKTIGSLFVTNFIFGTVSDIKEKRAFEILYFWRKKMFEHCVGG